MDTVDPVISVVIPVYNEAASLRELYERLVATLESMEKSFEIVMVNDGSQDNSLDILRELRAKDKRLRVIQLTRNFGQSPALYAGFEAVRGAYIVMMDADLQNVPEDIPKLVAKLEEGHDLVSGWRVDRRDNYFRHLASRALNRFIAWSTKIPLHDCGCSLKALRRELVEHMELYSHRCRYLSVDAAMLSGNATEVAVQHNERTQGKSKYPLFKLVRTAFDLLTGITAVPLQIIGLAGWISAGIGFLTAMRVLYVRIVYGNTNEMAAVVAVFFCLAGIQMISTGLMCEYVSRIYVEVQRKPYYIVKEELE